MKSINNRPVNILRGCTSLCGAAFQVFIALVLISTKGASQCGIATPVPISDNTSTSISLIVAGATNNDLANPNQGICQVFIKFRHSSLGDLNMYLISPGGQIVQLIGPGGVVANITQFTTWNISFTPCSDGASPDPGFNDEWNSTELWGSFASYNGTYYPYNSNCLEDFDLGVVNGTWSLLVEDVSSFDVGIIQEFSIVFCDDTGIDCTTCAAAASEIVGDTIELCYGQPISKDDITIMNPSPGPDTMDYKSLIAIFNVTSNTLDSYLTSNEQSILSPATYQVCGISISVMDTSSLPPPGISTKPITFQDDLNQAGLCADIGSTCQTIIVYPVSDTIIRNEEICNGDSLIINNITFSEQGQFIITFKGENCDTVSLLRLNVLDFKPIISQQYPFITCTEKQMYLYAQTFESGKKPDYFWRTSNGNIVGNSQGDSILINAPGIYTVVGDFNGCKDSTVIEIKTDLSLPVLTINSPQLSCKIDSVLVSISSTHVISNVMWSGPTSFTQIGNNILVGSPGSYVATVTDPNQCTVISSFLVTGDFTKSTLGFSTDTLSCMVDSVRLTIFDSTNISSVNWTGPYPVTEPDNLNTTITKGGLYQLEITGFNGCLTIFDINIIDTSYTINAVLNNDTISCMMPIVSLIVTVDRPVNMYQWNGPDISQANDTSAMIKIGGLYSVTVTNASNCTGIADVFIEENKNIPSVDVQNDTLSCVNKSVILMITNPLPTYTYLWSGPFNFTSTLAEPIASNPGIYVIKVDPGNGCTSVDSLIVLSAPDLPIVNWLTDTFDCFSTIANITPLDTAGFDFVWNNPLPITDRFQPQAQFTDGGIKYVLVTNRANGCFKNFEVLIPDLRAYPLITVDVEELDCDSDSVQINVSSVPPIDSITWYFNGGFFSALESPFALKAGMYTYSSFSQPGCILNDTLEVILNLSTDTIVAPDRFIDCSKNTTTITASSSNAIDFQWYKDGILVGVDSTITVDQIGQYETVVTFMNGCIDTATLSVSYDTLSPITIIDGLPFFDCVFQSRTLTAISNEPNVSYVWSGPGISNITGDTLLIDTPGIYTIISTDTSSCISSTMIEIIDKSDTFNIDIQYSNITCDSIASVTLNPEEPPILVFWDAPINLPLGTLKFETDVSGSYIFMALSEANCLTYGTINIVEDTLPPFIDNILIDTLNCEKSISQIFINSPDSISVFTLSGPENVVSHSYTSMVSKNGNYIALIEGANGCIVSTPIFVPLDTIMPSITFETDTLSCTKTKIDIDFSTDIPLKLEGWIRPDSTYTQSKIKINKGGLYIAYAIGTNGCETRDSLIIPEQKETPTLLLQDTFLLPCNGDPVLLFVDSPDSLFYYRWVGQNNLLLSQAATTATTIPQKITLFAATKTGCNAIDTAIVIVDLLKPTFGAISDTINCASPMATLIATDIRDDLNYHWIDENNVSVYSDTLRTSMPGEYRLVAETANKCTDTLHVQVQIDTIRPVISIKQEEPFNCKDYNLRLLGSIFSLGMDFSYTWKTSEGNFVSDTNTLTPLVDKEAIYTLEATDKSNGCINSLDYFLPYYGNSLDSYKLDYDGPTCLGGSDGFISLSEITGGLNPYQISINNTLGLNEIMITDLLEGRYDIDIFDSLGCLLDTFLVLDPGFSYSIDLQRDTTINLGDNFLLMYSSINGVPIASNLWQSEGLDLCTDCDELLVMPGITTTYILTAMDENGCIAVDSAIIRVTDQIKFSLANTFSPNGDGNNDIYTIPDYPSIQSIDYIKIYDRWGNLIYYEFGVLDPEFQLGWDGTFGGQDAIVGVYVLNCQITLINGKKIILTTDITLLR